MFDLIKKIFFLLFLFIIAFINLTCRKSPVQPDDYERFAFTFEDASCTEAWFNLKLNNLSKPVMVKLYRDNFLDKTFNIYGTNDTVFYIEKLLPKKSYEVYIEVQPANDKFYRSNVIRFTTMDTTTNEFSWQVWEFGSKGSSALYDVAIIDENNIWAVGEIYTEDTYTWDSLGNWIEPYNAVHWDGTKWELKRIQFYTFCGQQHTGSYPAKSVFAFGSNDVWIAMDGSQVVRWNGSTQSQPICTPVSINKLWGSSSNDLYAVGNNGNIAHWDGRKWTKIESGIENNFQSIYSNSSSRQLQEIIVVASEEFSNLPTELIKINPQDKTAISISGHNLPAMMKDIWFKSGKRYIAVGNGIYSTKKIDIPGSWKREVNNNINKWFTTAIDGENYNDIIVCGSSGELLHFNGYRWKNITYQAGLSNINRLTECKIKNGIIVCVGFTTDGKGIIATGRRN